MSYIKSHALKALLLAIFLISVTACGDNLVPSSEDNRPTVIAGTQGYLPTQKAQSFSLTDTDNQTINLADYLQAGSTPADAIVVYFTMWCSTCAAHTGDIVSTIKPLFTGDNIEYFIIDYVSGSVSDTIREKERNISDSWGLTVLSDYQNIAKDQLHGGMGVTIVIDGDGTILFNQDYGNGLKVVEALNQALIP